MITLGMIGPWQILIILFGLLLPIIALIDVLRSNFKGSNDKLIWVLVVLFLNVFGSVLYFLIGTGQKIKK
ncbi:PLD nuclease N-terminal domain-containing protein [Mesoflavibacter sp. CH_XMU1404-2]|uniref:PLD nuclease N-terminal domain-containing protein n=1 Tax=Mesoflavibacter sp. CH_XMU1404-2 TaxID=3107766 RepID=UPI003009DE44|tara:strand:+ start:74 stop:283 length:210 start_codon:yes stop_codon:yes gene_type:complete